MNKSEVKEKIISFLEKYEKIEAVYESLKENVGIDPESKLFEALYIMVNPVISYLEKELGDKHQTIDWFVWENDVGKKGLEAKAKSWKKLRPIKTVDDLVDLIMD